MMSRSFLQVKKLLNRKLFKQASISLNKLKPLNQQDLATILEMKAFCAINEKD